MGRPPTAWWSEPYPPTFQSPQSKQLNLLLLVHVLQSVKESGEEEAGSAGDSGSQVDPGSAEQAEDQLAAPHADGATGEELQQVCDPRLESEAGPV